jgi:hypothetical protein
MHVAPGDDAFGLQVAVKSFDHLRVAAAVADKEVFGLGHGWVGLPVMAMNLSLIL